MSQVYKHSFLDPVASQTSHMPPGIPPMAESYKKNTIYIKKFFILKTQLLYAEMKMKDH